MSAAPKVSQRLKYTILVNPGSSNSEPLSFDKSITIGRLPDNDVVITNDPRVSRQHIRVEIEGDGLQLIGLSEKNPILIDGKKVLQYHLTSEECSLQIGNSKIKISIQKSFGKAEAVPLAALSPSPPPSADANGSPDQGVARPSPLVGVGGSAAPVIAPSHVPKAAAPPKGSGAAGGKQKRTKARAKSGTNKNLIYGLIVALMVGGYLYLQNDQKKAADQLGIRSAEDIQADLAKSQMRMDELKKQKDESGQSSKMYEAAQAYYVRGFRDYRQGQFRRALQSFQAALSFYPDHQLARQYLKLAEVQADRMDRANMQQGRKYKDRGHYNLCQAAFQKVMTSIKDPQNATYKEAKTLHDECTSLSEGKY